MGARDDATASSTSPASPTISRRLPATARPARRTPLRNTGGRRRGRPRSTVLRRCGGLHVWFLLARRACISRTSVPRRAAAHAGRAAWRPIRPITDSRTPSRSSGTASRSKPSPRSRTNASTGRRRPRRRPDRCAGVPDGVEHRLARRGEQRVGAVVDRAVADHDRPRWRRRARPRPRRGLDRGDAGGDRRRVGGGAP